jgi:ATP-binding cassette subfamily B protein
MRWHQVRSRGQRSARGRSDSRHIDSIGQRWRYLPRLLQLLWELGPRHLVLLALFSMAAGLLPVVSLVLLQRLVDSAAGVINGTVPLVVALLWLAGLLLAHFFHAITDFWENGWAGLMTDTQAQLKARAQERFLAKASRLSLAAFERPDFYDQLLRAERGIEARLLNTIEYLMPIPADLLAAVGLLLYVGSAHFLFPIILLAGLLPITITNTQKFRKGYALERQQAAPERMMQYLGDLMVERQAAAEIRLFGLREYLLSKRQRLFAQLRQERLGLARAYLRRSVLSMTGEQLTAGLVLAGVVVLIARGHLSVGYFAAYWTAAERFRSSLGFLLRSVAVIDTDLRYIGDLFDYLDVAEERGAPAPGRQSGREAATIDPTPPWRKDHLFGIGSHAALAAGGVPTVRFEAVSFIYPGSERLVLDRIDLALHPGERLALVGENGAGKSTLAKLLLGLYSPTSGRITVNGTDLNEIDPSHWRAQVAAVFQDFVRYELTVRENITYGDLQRLEDEDILLAAAIRSGADQVIAALPGGYTTVLGKSYEEEGQDLSTGQWQKLAIARAYFRDASVLVLDEPTAALDARGEVEVYRRFRDMAEGKSVLLISHRLGSARLADRIVVLEEGRVVEEGRHADLLRRNGRYAEMYSIQASWYR